MCVGNEKSISNTRNFNTFVEYFMCVGKEKAHQ